MRGWVNLPLRTRLYAITLLTVLSAMVGLALIVDIATREAIFRSIDGELNRRAQDFARVAAQRPGGRPGEFPPMMGRGELEGNPSQRGPQDPAFQPGEPGQRNPQNGFQRRGGGPAGVGPGGVGPGVGAPGGGPGGGMGVFFRGPGAIYAPRFLPFDEGDNRFPADQRREPYDAEALKKVLSGSSIVFSNITIENEPVRTLSFPVFSGDRRLGTVQAVYPLADFLGSLNRLRMVLLTVILPLSLALSLLGARFLVSLVEKPLRSLNEEAELIQGDRLDRRLPTVGNDEFAQLSATINQMLDRIQLTVDQEREAKRILEASLERQKRFTADASHELKTPIAVIKAHAGLLKSEKDLSEDEKESIESIDEASDRMTRLVKNLLLLARLDAQKSASVSQDLVRLSETLTKAVDGALKSTGASPTSIQTSWSSDLTILGSQDDLLRLFQNLVENALKYGMPAEGGTVQVFASSDEGQVKVVVKDSGPGIQAEHLPHLFERFYRVDKSRSTETGGTGLGLSICHEIVRSHGGDLTVESEVGNGTTFTVSLPRKPHPRLISLE